MSLKNIHEAEDFLFTTVPKTSAEAFKDEKALVKSRRFFEALGNPQNARPAIHIAATSGKGTIAHMIESILIQHGKKVVTITSPHVYTVRERVRIGSVIISESDFVETLNRIRPAYDELTKQGSPPSYFEVNVAIGFLWAQKLEVDYVVVETGLGGLLDTTNTIDRQDKVNVLGQIGFDHMHILGNSLEEIAAQKAGIIGTAQHTLALKQDHAVNNVFTKAAKKAHAHLEFVTTRTAKDDYANISDLNQSLAGEHQFANLSLALAACQALADRDNWDVDSEKVKAALAKISLPGRFEIVEIGNKTYIFDGAHNKQKLSAVLQAMNERFSNEAFGALFASGQQEVAEDLALMISHHAEKLILCEYHSLALDMYKPTYDYTLLAKAKGYDFYKDPALAAEKTRSSSINTWLVTGSFYVLADVRRALENAQ